MKIELLPKYPPLDPVNVSTVYSKEFAELVRELDNKQNFDSIKGKFEISKSGKGRVTLELMFSASK